jgi:hypothetical protein
VNNSPSSPQSNAITTISFGNLGSGNTWTDISCLLQKPLAVAAMQETEPVRWLALSGEAETRILAAAGMLTRMIFDALSRGTAVMPSASRDGSSLMLKRFHNPA